MDGSRARPLNKFTGTSNAISGVESLREEKLQQQVLAGPQLANKTASGNYVALGIAPAGGAYVFVDNKNINSLAKAEGKKVAVLAYDKIQAQMVAQVGATLVPCLLIVIIDAIDDSVPAPIVRVGVQGVRADRATVSGHHPACRPLADAYRFTAQRRCPTACGPCCR